MAEEYLQEKVRNIVEPLISSLLKELPEDPMFFMYNWLKQNTNTPLPENNPDKEELIKLRIEIAKLKAKIEKKTKEIEESKQRQLNNNKSNSQTGRISINSKQSNNNKKKKFNRKAGESSGSEAEDENTEEQKAFDKKIQEQRNKLMKRGQRASVSAEAFGKFNKKETFKPRVIPKTPDQIEKIKIKISQSFMFNSLEDQDLQTVLLAFEEKRYQAGEYVIKQGDQGDVIYLVDTGELDCEKVFKKGDPPTYLKTYYPGESFGELALLYNALRAASIKAKTACLLWALDRGTFNNIVKEAAIKKRNRYEASLKKVPILSTIDVYELSQICDAIKSEKVDKGTYIIKQGEQGDKFYILDEGEAYAAKVFNEGEEAKNVKEYVSGDYFGELALLRDEPRAASIIAKCECKLLSLDRTAFKRLLGPLEKILKRNIEVYAIYNKKFSTTINK